MEGPLSGIRVLAIETALAGPFGSTILGDLGADVIKIEPPTGDLSRLSAGPNHNGESSHLLAYNRNKRGIIQDIRTPTGKEAFYDLVKISDVVWNNLRVGAMERLGADFDTLKKINPRIICTNITGWGPSGPYANRGSTSVIAESTSGMLSITGEPGGRPIRPGPAVADLSTSLYAVIGTISALYERERTGVGQTVDVSLLGSSIALMSYHIAMYTCSGVLSQPLGTGYWMAVPHGAYKTKDSYIVVGPCWPRIARVIGAEWLIDEPKFGTLASRIEHRQELDKIVEQYTIKATTEEWLPLFEVEDIPCAPLNTVDKVITDPQVNHINMILTLEHSLGGKITIAGNPIMMPSLKGEHRPPNLLGEHTIEVLTELLGYSEDKIAKLKEEQEAHIEELKAHTRRLI